MTRERRFRMTRGMLTSVLATLVAAVIWTARLGWGKTSYRLPPSSPATTVCSGTQRTGRQRAAV